VPISHVTLQYESPHLPRIYFDVRGLLAARCPTYLSRRQHGHPFVPSFGFECLSEGALCMSMNVFGLSPANETGGSFSRSVWEWRPLAECVCVLCPQETAACTSWQFDDGDGLTAAGARRLGERLEALLADGTISAYVAERDEGIATAPLETCIWCNGLGVREQSERECPCHGSQDQCITCNGSGLREKRQCLLCAGQRKRKPADVDYFLTVDGIREFTAFVLASGGFEIW
jgi:hypothetical protein